MISKILIRNFQSHRRTIIDFNNGINVFVGISDKGKTVIIRAIRWIVYNKPSGDAFRSYWGGDTMVELTLSDGNVIKRVKTNSENYYQINNDKPLKAFGQGVPDEVSKILNLEEVNIQQQLDAPFLLSETSGEVAAHFNRIAGISIIDRSITKAKWEVTRTKTNLSLYETDLQEKLEKLKGYENLDSIEKKVRKLDVKDQERKTLKKETLTLSNNVSRLGFIEEELTENTKLLNLEGLVKKILDKNKEGDTKTNELEKLRKLKSRITIINTRLEQVGKLIQLEQPIKNMLNNIQKAKQFKADLKVLTILAGKHTNITKKWQEGNEKLVELVAILPEVCFVCGGTGKLK